MQCFTETKRIYLTRYPVQDEHSDYINAVPVDGFRFKEQFIATQIPLPHTVGDFWRMVDEQNVGVILSLNEIDINDKVSNISYFHTLTFLYMKYKYCSLNILILLLNRMFHFTLYMYVLYLRLVTHSGQPNME